MPGGQRPPGMPEREAPADMTPPEEMPEQTGEGQTQQTESTPQSGFGRPGGGGMSGGRMPDDFGNEINREQQNISSEPLGFFGFVKAYSTPIISLVMLAGAFAFVLLYKRKNY